MASVSPAGPGLRTRQAEAAPAPWRPGLLFFLGTCSDKQPPDPWPWGCCLQDPQLCWGQGSSVFVFHAGFLQG